MKMAKGDWWKPKPVRYALEVQLTPGVFSVIDTNTNEVYYTNDQGYVRITQPQGREVDFTLVADGFHPYHFGWHFPIPNHRMDLTLEPIIIVPIPEPIPEPTGPILGDWLTCHHPDGKILYPSVYPVASPELRVRIIEALKHNKYTDTFVDVAYSARNNDEVFQHPGWNYLTSDPQPFIDACNELRAHGIRCIAMVGYQKDIAPPFDEFKIQLENFLQRTGNLLSGVVAGAEAEEYWKFDEIGEVLKLSAQFTTGFLGYHGGRNSWGPDGGQSTEWKPGGRQVSWWKWLKELIPNRELLLFFQYDHFIKYSNGGFSTSDAHIIADTEILVTQERLGGLGIKIVAAEHNYLTPDHMSKHSGNVAFNAGASGGRINGGSLQ